MGLKKNYNVATSLMLNYKLNGLNYIDENILFLNLILQIAVKATEMMKALEGTTEAVAHQQLRDMLNNAITDPDKFHNLSLKAKYPNVGNDI